MFGHGWKKRVLREGGFLFEGSVVPVRCDPANLKHAVLDVPALEARQSQAAAGHQA